MEVDFEGARLDTVADLSDALRAAGATAADFGIVVPRALLPSVMAGRLRRHRCSWRPLHGPNDTHFMLVGSAHISVNQDKGLRDGKLVVVPDPRVPVRLAAAQRQRCMCIEPRRTADGIGQAIRQLTNFSLGTDVARSALEAATEQPILFRPSVSAALTFPVTAYYGTFTQEECWEASILVMLDKAALDAVLSA